MNQLMLKLRILLRAEMTLFKAEAQRRTNRVICVVASLACVLVSLVFVNLGTFFYLTDSAVQAKAAFILAMVNFVIAVIPIILSRQSKPDQAEVMVREIRETALDELNRDAEAISGEITALREGVKQLRSGIGLPGAGISLLATLLPIIIDLLKKNKVL